MSIGPYNGWDAKTRVSTLTIQREALRLGLIPWPSRCSICGYVEGDDQTGRTRLGLHDENYGDPLSAYAICSRCHGHLHRRFDRPRPWSRLVAAHGDGTRWFEKLSMDPACLLTPFEITYPLGLPVSY